MREKCRVYIVLHLRREHWSRRDNATSVISEIWQTIIDEVKAPGELGAGHLGSRVVSPESSSSSRPLECSSRRPFSSAPLLLQ